MIAPARPDPQPYRLALTTDELADALAVSPRTIRAMVHDDTIPHRYIGRSLRFSVRAVQEWLDTRPVMPSTEETANDR